MSRLGSRLVQCQVCGRSVPAREGVPAGLVRNGLLETVQAERPDWSSDGFICLRDLNHYRTLHVQRALKAERGELTELERQVLDSVRESDLLARDVNRSFETDITTGERVADAVARFGGSWAFILSFGVVMFVWISVNSVALLWRPWDPYPFILLNLMLSCLAALQAPVIMMSQNRQEAKDRIRAENDYRVNLKAELEIRNLHAKMDLLLSHQWQRLLEIQEIQTEMMEELISRGRRGPPPGEPGH